MVAENGEAVAGMGFAPLYFKYRPLVAPGCLSVRNSYYVRKIRLCCLEKALYLVQRSAVKKELEKAATEGTLLSYQRAPPDGMPLLSSR